MIAYRTRVPLLAGVVALCCAQGLSAAVFTYQDDFETDKAKLDGIYTAKFVEPEPPWVVGQPAVLFYQPLHGGRGLAFLGVERAAEIAYSVLPRGLTTTGGTIEFDFYGNPWGSWWECRYSSIRVMWQGLQGPLPYSDTLEIANYPGHYSVAVPSGLRVDHFRLIGVGQTAVIDNLKITVTYVPEPVGFLIAAAAVLPLMTRRRRTYPGMEITITSSAAPSASP